MNAQRQPGEGPDSLLAEKKAESKGKLVSIVISSYEPGETVAMNQLVWGSAVFICNSKEDNILKSLGIKWALTTREKNHSLQLHCLGAGWFIVKLD